MVGKVVAGIFAVALTSTSAWGVTVLLNQEPLPKTLKEADPATTYGSDTIGNIEANKTILVANIEDNRDGGNWKFANMGDKSKQHSHFSSVSVGGNGTPTETDASAVGLNKLCDDAYKKKKTDLTSETASPTLKDSIKALCTRGTTDIATA